MLLFNCLGTVLSWQVHEIFLNDTTNDVVGWSYKYGSNVFTPSYEYQASAVSNKIRLCYNHQEGGPTESFTMQIQDNQRSVLSNFINLVVTKVMIRDAIVYCDVDMHDLQYIDWAN